MRQADRDSDNESEDRRRKYKLADDSSPNLQSRGKNESYKCGDLPCSKTYQSYTAFYNHCKKSHQGQFPKGSLRNMKPFDGPSRNRGRPRIKKNETKDSVQIQSMKKQNELIEFLGTIKNKKRDQSMIIVVQDPKDSLQSAINIVREWLLEGNEATGRNLNYLNELQSFNLIVISCDLPQFYDPVEVETYKDSLDSYSFTSIFNFMSNPQKRMKFKIHNEGLDLFYRIYLIWLARILCKTLLAEVIYTVLQVKNGVVPFQEKDLLTNKSKKFKEITDEYFACFWTEHNSSKKGQKKGED